MSGTTITIDGNSNASNLVLGSASGSINSAEHEHIHPTHFVGNKYQHCLETSNTGKGPGFIICQFRIKSEMYLSMKAYMHKTKYPDVQLPANLVGLDASWSEYLLEFEESKLAAAQASVALGLDLLTSVHYSYQTDPSGLPTDNSNSGLVHVTHIYPSVLDLITVWNNNNGGSSLDSWPLPAFGAATGGVNSAESYIEWVNMPPAIQNEWRKKYNAQNPYSLGYGESGESLFRDGQLMYATYRPEGFRDGTILKDDLVLMKDGVDVISKNTFWDFTTKAAAAVFNLDYWKALLPNMSSTAKMQLPPPTSVLNKL
jgi:hypothetical protein